MVAAAKPFIPDADDGKPPPAERPFALGSASAGPAAPDRGGEVDATAKRAGGAPKPSARTSAPRRNRPRRTSAPAPALPSALRRFATTGRRSA